MCSGDTKVRLLFGASSECPLNGFRSLSEAVPEHSVSGVGIDGLDAIAAAASAELKADEEPHEVLGRFPLLLCLYSPLIPQTHLFFLVLVGLAGTGKTTWANEQQEKDFNKNWLIVGPLTCLQQAHVDVEGEENLLKVHPLSKVKELFRSVCSLLLPFT